MSEQPPTPTLAQLDDYARHQFYGTDIALVAGLTRRIEALARTLGVRTNALASHLLLTALDAHEGEGVGDTAAPAPTAQAETKVNITNADASGSWAKDGTVVSFEWSGQGEVRQVFSGEVSPRRRSLAECMVILLDDEAIVAQLRAVATPGCFGQVIHDVAAAMAGEL